MKSLRSDLKNIIENKIEKGEKLGWRNETIGERRRR